MPIKILNDQLTGKNSLWDWPWVDCWPQLGGGRWGRAATRAALRQVENVPLSDALEVHLSHYLGPQRFVVSGS